MYSSSPTVAGLVQQSMPMAAIFLRNKFIAWFAVIQNFHYVLNTDYDELKLSSTTKSSDPLSVMDQSPMIRFFMAIAGLVACYLDMVFPQKPLPPRDSSSTTTTTATTATTATATVSAAEHEAAVSTSTAETIVTETPADSEL